MSAINTTSRQVANYTLGEIRRLEAETGRQLMPNDDCVVHIAVEHAKASDLIATEFANLEHVLTLVRAALRY